MSESESAAETESKKSEGTPSSNPQSAIRNPKSSATKRSKKRDPDPDDRPEDRWSIRFWRSVVVLFSRLYHHLNVRTRNPLPNDGAAILVCNHISGLDPVLLQAASSRLIIWMMAKEYYDLKSLNWFFKIVEAIPVDRGSRDSASMRSALRALENGRVLGVFPEGRIETSEELLPFHTGVALMAIKTGVPVYPAYLDGTTRGKEMVPAVLHPNTIALRFGPEIKFDRSDKSREGLEKATEVIRSTIESLRQNEIELRKQLSL